MRRLSRPAKLFRSNETGSVAILFSLMAVPLFGVVGLAVDYGRALNVKTKLQKAADVAALAATSSPLTAEEDIITLAKNTFNKNYTHSVPTTALTVTRTNNEVRVVASASVPTSVSKLFHIDAFDVSESATAERLFGDHVCMLALDPTMEKAIDLTGNAILTATGCAVHSNSSHNNGMHAQGGATATAEAFCSVGKASGSGFTPAVKERCYAVTNPFASLAPPAVGACDENGLVLKKHKFTLSPGVYCGGLKITNDATVDLEPGVYVIKDGGLAFDTKTTVVGNGVMFYFTGSNTFLDVSSTANVTLSGPSSGQYAGLVFYQDPTSNPGQPTGSKNKLNGSGSINITGSAYFPTQAIEITGGASFGASSPVLAFVAKNFVLSNELNLNVDLAAGNMAASVPRMYLGSRLLK